MKNTDGIRPKFKFTLGRKVDITYPTNRWLVLMMLFVAFLTFLFSKSFNQSLLTAGGFFFAWAIAREVDPLKEYAAFISGGLTVILMSFYLFDGINFGPLFFMLLSLRFISGICGYQPTYVDFSSIILLAGYLSYSRETFIYFFILALMFIFSWCRYSKNAVYLIGTGSSLILSAVFYYIYTAENLFSSLPLSPVGIYILRTIIIFAGIFLYFSFKKDLGIKDDLGKEISPKVIIRTLLYFILSIFLLMTFENLTQNTHIILLSTLAGPALQRLGDASF